MGFRLVSRKWQLAAAFMVAPALAFGYYAGDPENLGISVNATLSGAGSVHGRHVVSRRSTSAHPKIAREAAHLFSGPHRGPRADRYMMLTRSTGGVQPERKVVRAPVKADMLVTGSIPKAERNKVAALTIKKTEHQNVRPNDRREEFGLLPTIPVAERTSASLFMSFLTRPQQASFPEMLSLRDVQSAAGPLKGKIKFKGETELEYQARQRRCLATAIYFEARGEPIQGQIAVAQVVMNRVRSSLYPDTICGVVYQGQNRRSGCQFSFTCDGRADVPKDKEKWRKVNEVAKHMTDGESWLGDIGHATHYHANYVKPRWRRELNRVKRVGRHIFYRVRGNQIEDVLKEESPARGLALSGSG